jgi:acetylglutamate kinase
MDDKPITHCPEGKLFVIKCCGKITDEPHLLENVLEDIAHLHDQHANRIICVHGGMPDPSTILQLGDIWMDLMEGRLYTDENTIRIIERILMNKVNAQIVAKLQKISSNPVIGLSGKKEALLLCRKKTSNGKNLGWVGEINEVRTKVITDYINNRFVAILAPIGTDSKGQSYNINPDHAASTLAQSLNADHLVFISLASQAVGNNDLVTPASQNPETRIISLQEAQNLLQNNKVPTELIRTFQYGIQSLSYGVKNVHFIVAKEKNFLLKHLSNEMLFGTIVKM